MLCRFVLWGRGVRFTKSFASDEFLPVSVLSYNA